MAKLHEVAKYIRSKNAGPFWVTEDIFCDSDEAYRRVAESTAINAETVAAIYSTDAEAVKLFRLFVGNQNSQKSRIYGAYDCLLWRFVA